MMDFEEIVKLENNRNEETLKNIYLHKESGKSEWFRAFGVSSYYAHQFDNKLNEKNKIKVTRKLVKNLKEDITQIGLREISFKKYFPNAKINKISDDEIIIEFKNDDIELNINNYNSLYTKWKDNYEIESKNKTKENINGETQYWSNNKKQKMNNIFNKPATFFLIFQEIVGFDERNRSEEDLRDFVHKLKNMCFNLMY